MNVYYKQLGTQSSRHIYKQRWYWKCCFCV